MAANELTFPIVANAVALPAATPTVVLTIPVNNTIANVSLTNPIYNPAGLTGQQGAGTGVVVRGVMVVTGAAGAGTITIRFLRNGATQVDAAASQPLTLPAGSDVVNIPFEFIDTPQNPGFGNQWFYTISATASAASTVNNAKAHYWVV